MMPRRFDRRPIPGSPYRIRTINTDHSTDSGLGVQVTGIGGQRMRRGATFDIAHGYRKLLLLLRFRRSRNDDPWLPDVGRDWPASCLGLRLDPAGGEQSGSVLTMPKPISVAHDRPPMSAPNRASMQVAAGLLRSGNLERHLPLSNGRVGTLLVAPPWSRRGLIGLAICVVSIAFIVAPAGASSVDEQGRPVTMTSSSIMDLAAASFGAGTALLVTSLLVEGEYEKVVGYMDHGDFRTITISGGSDTDGLRVAGAAMVLLGCLLSLPTWHAGADDAHASAGMPSEATPAAGTDLVFEPVSLNGRAAGIGVGIGF